MNKLLKRFRIWKQLKFGCAKDNHVLFGTPGGTACAVCGRYDL